jgi:hypothetical protein
MLKAEWHPIYTEARREADVAPVSDDREWCERPGTLALIMALPQRERKAAYEAITRLLEVRR